METRGGVRWRVRIRPGTLERVTAGEFCAEVNIAFLNARHDYAVAAHRLLSKQRGTRIGPKKPNRITR